MKQLHILGDSPRKSKYDPRLADLINKKVEASAKDSPTESEFANAKPGEIVHGRLGKEYGLIFSSYRNLYVSPNGKDAYALPTKRDLGPVYFDGEELWYSRNKTLYHGFDNRVPGEYLSSIEGITMTPTKEILLSLEDGRIINSDETVVKRDLKNPSEIFFLDDELHWRVYEDYRGRICNESRGLLTPVDLHVTAVSASNTDIYFVGVQYHHPPQQSEQHIYRIDDRKTITPLHQIKEEIGCMHYVVETENKGMLYASTRYKGMLMIPTDDLAWQERIFPGLGALNAITHAPLSFIEKLAKQGRKPKWNQSKS